MKLRWKKNPKPTGLARIGAGPRGSVLSDGDKKYASIEALTKQWGVDALGWFWTVPTAVFGEYVNTYKTPCDTEEEAKRQAMEYVKEKLKELEKNK